MPKPAKVRLVRGLRKSDAPAEAVLWKSLRNRALGGFKFRRQHPIGAYVADFACVECKVVVKLDGESHLAREAEDEERSRFLEDDGWHVIRFWNTELYENLDGVMETIWNLCLQRAAQK